jgi:hypothetical protein
MTDTRSKRTNPSRVCHCGCAGPCDPRYLYIRGHAPGASPDELFWAKVNRNGPVPDYANNLGPCWVWTANRVGGYGTVTRSGKVRKAHRVAWELMIGSVPEGLDLDHLCRVRHCVNPAHLEPVTRRENILRGEGIAAKRAAQTHCVNGHEFTHENTINHKSDPPHLRHCRECARIRQREWIRRKRENLKKEDLA